MNETKEVDVFKKYSRFNKLKVIVISTIIFLVLSVSFYLFAKTLFPYYITYETDGGLEYDHELKPQEYSFRERTHAPENVKKKGYYLVGWFTDKACTREYKFGQKIWSSFTLYAKWAPGYAVLLNFADGEAKGEVEGYEDKYISTTQLKVYYEWYVKPGTNYELPHVFNTVEGAHKGEQLLFYDDAGCTGDPYENKTFTVDRDINIYGKWFDTDVNKFQISTEGVLEQYLGDCNKIYIPFGVNSIRDAASGEGFNTGRYGTQLNDTLDHFSVWHRVRRDLKEVYIGSDVTSLGNCAFRACENLQKVVFVGNNINHIGVEAFRDCGKLNSLVIPEGVTDIAEACFSGMGAYPMGNHYDAQITFLGEIQTIGDNAFLNCWVTELSFGNIQRIGKLAFAGCVHLAKITFDCDHVIETGVTQVVDSYDGAGDCDNLFYGADPTIVIYVPTDALVNSFKATTPWSTYASHIAKIAG